MVTESVAPPRRCLPMAPPMVSTRPPPHDADDADEEDIAQNNSHSRQLMRRTPFRDAAACKGITGNALPAFIRA